MNGVVGDVTVLLRQIMAEARHLTQVIQQIFLVCLYILFVSSTFSFT